MAISSIIVGEVFGHPLEKILWLFGQGSKMGCSGTLNQMVPTAFSERKTSNFCQILKLMLYILLIN